MIDKPPLSRLISGTMRMLETDRSVAAWADFFAFLHERGITTLHCSAEYDSFDLLCESLAVFRQQYSEKKIQFIVKLAAPDFKEHGFSEHALSKKIHHYLSRLNIQHLDVVQWMWRADLQNDAQRYQHFALQADMIGKIIGDLKTSGVIGQFMCFPYSPIFAEQSLQYDFIDGLIAYHNPRELEYTAAFAQAAKQQKTGIGIRPFAAGKAFCDANTASALLANTLSQPGIEHAIVGLSSKAHVEALTC